MHVRIEPRPSQIEGDDAMENESEVASQLGELGPIEVTLLSISQ